jgi:predicted CXXCH cytochrome family protein
MRNIRFWVAAVGMTVAGNAWAVSSPHDGSYNSAVAACESCHQLHGSTSSGTLLKSAYSTNDAACLTCHNTPGFTADPNSPFNGGWDATTQASAGVAGIHHSWSATATNLGASVPTNTEMSKRVVAGKLQCAVCHDPHAANAPFVPGTSLRSSFPLGVAQNETSGTGTGTLTVVSIAGASPAGYTLKMVTANTFIISHDFYKATPTWLNWTGAAWAAGSSNGTGKPTGVGVTLDDPNVVVTFAGVPAVADAWVFYVSTPFLRADNSVGGMCADCHKDRNQTFQNVEGAGPLAGNGAAVVLGTTVFSHPVAQAMNANGHGYDRAVGAILDADGSLQSAGDGNRTNDLLTGTGGVVTCFSCHSPHNADSNSLTVDPQ